jgi:glycine oxidase
VNISVVGAGVVGCAVAYELASRGARVNLLDPRGTGRGATVASAGILAPYIEGHSESLLRLGVCSMSQWDEFVRRVQIDADRTVEYERGGTLQVGFDATEAAALTEIARRLQAAGVTHSLLDGHEAVALEPSLSPRAIAAIAVPSQGYVGPAPFMAALVAAATKRGVSQTRSRVLHIEDGRDAAVTTEHGVVHADAVILATGSWTSLLVPSPRDLVKPIRGQLLQLAMDQRPASQVIWGPGCYVVPWTDGTVLVGATVEDVGFDETTTAEGVRGLLAAATELLPVLGRARFCEARAGLRPKTADELPLIGRSSTMPHVFYAAGHYRNGVLLAPLTASLIADLVLDGRERPELADVRPDRCGL